MAQILAAPNPDILTTEERTWLAAHPILRLSPHSDYQPIDFFDEQGQHCGLTADYLALLEQRLGVHFQIVRVDLSNNQRDFDNPAELGADIKVAITQTPERLERWLFTKPYLEVPSYIITRKEAREALTLQHLEGNRVAVIWHYAARQYLTNYYPKLILDPVLDTRTGLRKVSFGLVDAFVSELPASTYWMEQEGITNLKIAGEAGYVYRLGIATRKDWPELHRILEKGLAQITPQERAAIYQKWVKMPMEVSLFSRRWGLTLLSGLGVIGLGVLGALWWNRSLAAQVRQRTAELQQDLQERRKVEQALQESEEQLRTIIETSPECVKLVDRDGLLLQMNQAGLKIIGAGDINEIRGKCIYRDQEKYFPYEPRRTRGARGEKVIPAQANQRVTTSSIPRLSPCPPCSPWFSFSEKLYQIIAAEYREAFQQFNERICAGEKGSLSFEIIGLDGTRRWIETYAVPIYDKKTQALVHLAIARDITDRKLAEDRIKVSEQQLHQLAGYLQTVREEERTAMAREIHDELGQALTAMKMDLVGLQQQLREMPAPLHERIAAMIEMTNATIHTVRKLATQLRPGILDDLGLTAALEWQAQEFQTRTGIACEFVSCTEIDEVEPERATAVFRICQEALTNVTRHAQATHVNIRLQIADNQLVLEITDNGRGVADGEWANPRSLGLMGMRERAFLLGGEFHLTANLPQGTTATACIPLSQANAKGGAL